MSAILPLPPEFGDVAAVLVKLPARVAEVILVGGASTADTAKLARATRARLHIVEQHDPGKEAAFVCGLAAADGEIVVMLDADSDISGLDRFIGALEDRAAFVSPAAVDTASGTS